MKRTARLASAPAAFTLVELLVAMTVLALMLGLTAQMVNQTMVVTSSSNKKMDAASMGRIVLDRFGNDFSTALLNNGASALYYTPMNGALPNPKANSSIGFIAQSRGRWTSFATVLNDIRGVVVGYKIRNLDLPYGTNLLNPLVPIPVLQRGDGRFTFSVADSSYNAAYEVNAIVGTKNARGQDVKRIPNDIVEMFPHPATSKEDVDGTILNYQGLGDGVLRFHISFVLDDGRTVQTLQQASVTPPLDVTYRNFIATGGTGTALPIAFTADTSNDLNKRYVKGLIVGVAVLDESTMRLAYQIDKDFAAKLATQIGRPTQDGETPVGVWQQHLLDITPLPVRQNIRFYQRFYATNL